MEWLIDERRLCLFLAGTILRDPHHCESLTHQEQDMNVTMQQVTCNLAWEFSSILHVAEGSTV